MVKWALTRGVKGSKRNKAKRSSIGPVVITASALISSAAAAQECAAVFQRGLYNTITAATQTSSYDAARQQICSEYNSFERTGRSTSGSAEYGAFGASGSYSKEQIRSLGRAMCEAGATESDVEAASKSAQQLVDPAAVNAYTDCIRAERQGLTSRTFYGNPTVITLVYNMTGATGPVKLNGVQKTDGMDCSGSLQNLANSVGNQGALIALGTNYTLTCSMPLLTSRLTGADVQYVRLGGRVVIDTAAGVIVRDIPPVLAPTQTGGTAAPPSLPVGGIMSSVKRTGTFAG